MVISFLNHQKSHSLKRITGEPKTLEQTESIAADGQPVWQPVTSCNRGGDHFCDAGFVSIRILRGIKKVYCKAAEQACMSASSRL
jgi:hypothetical protein